VKYRLSRISIAALLSVVSVFALAAQASVLDTVKRSGHVRCGINDDLPGFSTLSADGVRRGLDVDICRAVAAAVFGDAGKVKYVPTSTSQRFTALAAGDFDLLARNSTWNLSRDTAMGANFVAINYYDGQGFMVDRPAGYRSTLELDGATICVEQGTTHIKNLQDYFTLHRMKYTAKTYPDSESALRAYEQDQCDALTSDQSSLYALRTVLNEPREARILPEVISKEPLGPAVADGDDQWASIVRWTVYVMLNAEELGISSANVDRVREVSRVPAIRRLLGVEGNPGSGIGLPADWAYQVIRQVGNYAESFERNVGKGSPLKVKRGMNALWRDGGLHYAPPID
jgi:general L-amino acid transport system substrate-binding protein